MDRFLQEAMQALMALLFHPGSFPEMLITLLGGLLLFLMVYGKLGDWLGVPRIGSAASLLSGVVGAAIYAGVSAGIAVYLGAWHPAVVGVACSLVLIVPVICLLQKTGYQTALMNWAGGVAAFLIGAFLVDVAFDAVGFSKKVVDKDQQRQEQRKELE